MRVQRPRLNLYMLFVDGIKKLMCTRSGRNNIERTGTQEQAEHLAGVSAVTIRSGWVQYLRQWQAWVWPQVAGWDALRKQV